MRIRGDQTEVTAVSGFVPSENGRDLFNVVLDIASVRSVAALTPWGCGRQLCGRYAPELVSVTALLPSQRDGHRHETHRHPADHPQQGRAARRPRCRSDRYAIDSASAIQLSLAYARSERNRYLNFFTGEVEPEAANGNGPVWAATLIYSRALDEGLVGSLHASWKRRDANDFDPVNDLFIPARTQWSVGASLEQDLGPDLALTIGASAGRLTDEATIFTETTQRTDTWSISAGLSAAF